MDAAIGFSPRTGWAAAVVLIGPNAAPSVVLRRELELVDERVFEKAAYYHLAAEMPLDRGEKLVATGKAKALQHAKTAVEEIKAELEKSGHSLKSAGRLVADRKLPSELAAIIKSHAQIHAAEGDLYRRALADACEAEKLIVATFPKNGFFE